MTPSPHRVARRWAGAKPPAYSFAVEAAQAAGLAYGPVSRARKQGDRAALGRALGPVFRSLLRLSRELGEGGLGGAIQQAMDQLPGLPGPGSPGTLHSGTRHSFDLLDLAVDSGSLRSLLTALAGVLSSYRMEILGVGADTVFGPLSQAVLSAAQELSRIGRETPQEPS